MLIFYNIESYPLGVVYFEDAHHLNKIDATPQYD